MKKEFLNPPSEFFNPPSLKELAKQKFFEVALPKLASNEQQLNKSISSLCLRELIEEYWFDLFESRVMAGCYVIKMLPPFKEENLDPEINAYISCGDQVIFFDRGTKKSYFLSSDLSKRDQFDSAVGLNNVHTHEERRQLFFQDLEVIKGIVPFTPEMSSCVNDFYIFDSNFINCLVAATVRDFYRFIKLFKSLSEEEIKKIDRKKLFFLLGTIAAFDCVYETEKLAEKTPDQKRAILHDLLLNPNCSRELLIHACDKMNCCRRLKTTLPKVDDAQFRNFLESLKRIPFAQREKLGEVELLCLLGTQEAFDGLLTNFIPSGESVERVQKLQFLLSGKNSTFLGCVESLFLESKPVTDRVKEQVLRYLLLANDRKLLMYALEKMGLKFEDAFIDSDFSKWNLSGLDLQGLNFSRTKFIETDFTSANLNGSKLVECNCDWAIFSNASLIKTDFSNAYLTYPMLFPFFETLRQSTPGSKKIIFYVHESSIGNYINNYHLQSFKEFLTTVSVEDFFQYIKVYRNLPQEIRSDEVKLFVLLGKKEAFEFASKVFDEQKRLSMLHYFLFKTDCDYMEKKCDYRLFRRALIDFCGKMNCFTSLKRQVLFELSDEGFQNFIESWRRIPLDQRQKLKEKELVYLSLGKSIKASTAFDRAFTKFKLGSESIEEKKRVLQYLLLSGNRKLLEYAAKKMGLMQSRIFGDARIDLSHTRFNGWDLSNLRFDKIDVSSANFEGATLLGAQFSGAYVECANFTNAITRITKETELSDTGTTIPKSSDTDSPPNFQGVKGIGFWRLSESKVKMDHLSLFREDDKLTLIKLFNDYISGPIGMGFLTRNHIPEVKQVLREVEKKSVKQLIELLVKKLVEKELTVELTNSHGALYRRMDEFCLLKLGKSFSCFLDKERKITLPEASGSHDIPWPPY